MKDTTVAILAGISERIRDITHSRGVNDVRGACGSPCIQCQKDQGILLLITHLTEGHARELVEAEKRGREKAVEYIYDKIVNRSSDVGWDEVKNILDAARSENSGQGTCCEFCVDEQFLPAHCMNTACPCHSSHDGGEGEK